MVRILSWVVEGALTLSTINGESNCILNICACTHVMNLHFHNFSLVVTLKAVLAYLLQVGLQKKVF